jgi:hypothetical protein
MLTGEVWEQLGDVDPSRRQVMLRNLRKVPKVFALKASRSYHHYYRVSRGPLWSQRGKSDDSSFDANSRSGLRLPSVCGRQPRAI